MDKIINVLAADIAAPPNPIEDGTLAVIGVVAVVVAAVACFLIFRRKR